MTDAVIETRKEENNKFFNFDKVIEIEKNKSYKQGAKDFVEWFMHQDKIMCGQRSKVFYTCDNEGYITSALSIDELLSEWQKEVKND